MKEEAQLRRELERQRKEALVGAEGREEVMRVPVSYIAILSMRTTLIEEYVPQCATSTHFSF